MYPTSGLRVPGQAGEDPLGLRQAGDFSIVARKGARQEFPPGLESGQPGLEGQGRFEPGAELPDRVNEPLLGDERPQRGAELGTRAVNLLVQVAYPL